MGIGDNRTYRMFFGIYTNDWDFSFPAFPNHRYLLVDDYISDGCDTLDSSEASITHVFIYPHHIKKTYFMEGVASGHITLVANGCTSVVTSYKVTVCKVHEDTSETELATTGWKTVSDTLAWDAGLSIGDERVYPFWIDIWEKKELSEYERIYVKVEVVCNSCTHLMHSNDATWEDLKIDIPLRL